MNELLADWLDVTDNMQYSTIFWCVQLYEEHDHRREGCSLSEEGVQDSRFD